MRASVAGGAPPAVNAAAPHAGDGTEIEVDVDGAPAGASGVAGGVELKEWLAVVEESGTADELENTRDESLDLDALESDEPEGPEAVAAAQAKAAAAVALLSSQRDTLQAELLARQKRPRPRRVGREAAHGGRLGDGGDGRPWRRCSSGRRVWWRRRRSEGEHGHGGGRRQSSKRVGKSDLLCVYPNFIENHARAHEGPGPSDVWRRAPEVQREIEAGRASPPQAPLTWWRRGSRRRRTP